MGRGHCQGRLWSPRSYEFGGWGDVTVLPTPLGTSIRIFLANGGADGVWVVEKNWTGKALMTPRTRYKELRARPDLEGPGVYVLIGPTESGVPTHRVYIGETDDLAGRLDHHNRNKDFWNRRSSSPARTPTSTRLTSGTWRAG